VNHYYYLLSSLAELNPSKEEEPLPIAQFLDFCREQLTEKDYRGLKSLFLWNDMKNVLSYKKAGDFYVTPAYYGEDDFLQNLAERERFLPFISHYFNNQENGIYEFNSISITDELASLFYFDLDRLENRFVKDYYLFELNLRNLTTAMSLRKAGLPYTDKLIPFGTFYEDLLKSTSGDFDLAAEAPYIAELENVFSGFDLVKIEKAIDQVRWNWLSVYDERDYFSLESLYAYAVKLSLQSRWVNLKPDKGQELFDKLVTIIQRSVRFSIEILTAGDKKL
jgi:Protein of unknown function (DUF2764)